ncbi:flagellar basal body rod protein FlgC [Nitriliruptor alkaliphilus]|uniref:flagellar basal body rod protein FlgC n=1 Tax=Nitriliruptor alkaliphilus TaxID=427918 RepID=UPI0006965C32|nr:flagellar basal body rod C-terminal domain-containing protein [Nitriliruptor alkaliphilus]
MSTFSAMQIGRTGAGFAHHWIDTIAHNMANLETRTAPGTEPFRAVQLVARPNTGNHFATNGSGVYVAAQVEIDGDVALVHDPDNPLADEAGYVQAAHVDMGAQMTDLLIANRVYQANLRTVESAREAYQAALRIGGQ